VADDQQINIAGGVGFILGKGAIEPCRFNAGNTPERLFESRLNADRTLEQSKDRLEIWIGGIDAVIKLTALGFSAQKALATKAGELARNVGRIGVQCAGQLADVDTRGAVDVEESQQLSPELGTEGDHCSKIILHLQYKCTAIILDGEEDIVMP